MSMLPVRGSRSELRAGLLAGRRRQRSLRAQRHRVLGILRHTATAVLLLSIADPCYCPSRVLVTPIGGVLRLILLLRAWHLLRLLLIDRHRGYCRVYGLAQTFLEPIIMATTIAMLTTN